MEDRILDIIAIWAPVALLVLSAINACTKHYTKFQGVLRVIMSVVEHLSFLASKRTGKLVKAPLVSVTPDASLERMHEVKKQLEGMAKIMHNQYRHR